MGLSCYIVRAYASLIVLHCAFYFLGAFFHEHLTSGQSQRLPPWLIRDVLLTNSSSSDAIRIFVVGGSGDIRHGGHLFAIDYDGNYPPKGEVRMRSSV